METVEPKSTEIQAPSSVEMRRRQVVSFQTMNYRFLGYFYLTPRLLDGFGTVPQPLQFCYVGLGFTLWLFNIAMENQHF